MLKHLQGFADRINWEIALAGAASKAAEVAPQVAVSIVLIFLVLLLMAWIYRGSAGDEEIEVPVTLATLNGCGDTELVLAPRHLKESSVHAGKAPRVFFYLQGPGIEKYEFKAAVIALTITVRSRNSNIIYDRSYKEDPEDGGQIGIGQHTRDLIEKYFQDLYNKTGRRFDTDTAKVVVKLKYPSRINVDYIMREHPDPSVRLAAWLFLLTSLFSVVQSAVF